VSVFSNIFENSYEPTYDVIYDWESLEEISSDVADDEEEEFVPELLFPGSEEMGEA